MAQDVFTYFHVGANGTFTARSGQGILKRVTVNNPGATATVTVYDSLTGSGAIVAGLGNLVGGADYEYDCEVVNGITVVTTGGTPADITVVLA